MAAFLGQIPEEVDALAADFDAKATDIEGIISQLTAKLGGTTWTGSDQARFQGDWDSQLSGALRNVAGALRDAGSIARSNADQQRQASS